MGVSEPGVLKILNNNEMQELENQVIKLEELEKRKVKATAALKNRKNKTSGSGIFASTEGQDALPSSIIKKRRKLEENIGRNSDSILAGLEKGNFKDRKSAAAVVKKSEFSKLQNQVNAQGKFMEAFSRGQGVLQGASGLTSTSGIFGTLTGLASRIPFAGPIIAVATAAAERYVAQHRDGGTRDTRKKVLAEDVSDIGVENQTDIDSGRKLFLSNPLNNQGLPGGNSNTQNLRDGTRIYKVRREGTYQ